MFSIYFTALKSLAVKETNRYLRIWVQTLVPPVITTSLYFVIFGKMIGGRIGDMGGFSYMEFIVPGLIMMSAITSSYANVSSSFFSPINWTASNTFHYVSVPLFLRHHNILLDLLQFVEPFQTD